MDAQAIKNLGGALQIIGVVIVLWDLLNIHQYLGDLGRVTGWLRARWVQVEAALRRLLRRPGHAQVVHAQAASGVGIASSVPARLTPGPFVPQLDQPQAQQLAAQAVYLNRLYAWIKREVEERDRAVEEARTQLRSELQAEARRLDGLIKEVHGEVRRLRKLITGAMELRWLGVPILLAGIALSTWPDGWAQVWPVWLSLVVLGFLVACGLTGWICWLILARLRADSGTSSS
jgi:hypothetical protein